MSSSDHALRLGLGPGGSVLVEAPFALSAQLRSLQLAFPGSETVGRSSFEVDLGGFLTNLDGLARWTAAPVEWSEALRHIAVTALDDGDHLDALRRGAIAPANLMERRPQADWRGGLKALQERDLSRLLAMRHGANFSVPGAGKTRVALAFFSTLVREGTVERAIVVAPKSAHESWVAEARESFENGRVVKIYEGGPIPNADIVLVNYERLPTAQRAIGAALGKQPTLLVLDEAHRMKRGAAGAYGAACLALGPLAAARLVLSGTPAPNGLSDLRSLIEFAWPGRGSRLLPPRADTWSKDAGKSVEPLFTRTTKSELNLPPLNICRRTVELGPLHRELYDALLGVLRNNVRDDERIEDLGKIIVYLLMAATSPALLAVGSSRYEPLQFQVPPFQLPPSGVLRSLLADLPAYESSPKLEAAVSIARKNASEGRKTLIWSTFIRNLTTLQSMMPELKPEMIVGSTPDVDRAAALARFRGDPARFVLLSNPSTLGEGVSLHHECHEAVYVDRDFAAGRFLQSIDRIHRLGLSEDEVTNVTVLVADGTIDDLVDTRLQTKLRWMSGVLNDHGLGELADLEEERESGGVLDSSDVSLVRAYLGR